jgi:hypothetical protein
MTNYSVHRSAVRAFMNELAKAWPTYRSLGYAIAQRCSKEGGDIEYETNLLVDPTIPPGNFLREFTGVQEIVKIVADEVEFIDRSGQTLFATINFSVNPFKLKSMKIECPACFGEPQDPECSICSGSGRA